MVAEATSIFSTSSEFGYFKQSWLPMPRIPPGWWWCAVCTQPSVTMHHTYWGFENRRLSVADQAFVGKTCCMLFVVRYLLVAYGLLYAVYCELRVTLCARHALAVCLFAASLSCCVFQTLSIIGGSCMSFAV